MATGSAVKGVLITAAIKHSTWLATVHDIVKPRFQNLNGRQLMRSRPGRFVGIKTVVVRLICTAVKGIEVLGGAKACSD
jgi:hypothetical protein